MDVVGCHTAIPELSNAGTLNFRNMFFQEIQGRRWLRGSLLRVLLCELLPQCSQAYLAAAARVGTALSADEARDRQEADDEPQKRWQSKDTHPAADLKEIGVRGSDPCA